MIIFLAKNKKKKSPNLYLYKYLKLKIKIKINNNNMIIFKQIKFQNFKLIITTKNLSFLKIKKKCKIFWKVRKNKIIL